MDLEQATLEAFARTSERLRIVKDYVKNAPYIEKETLKILLGIKDGEN
jgi:hypothetical protein